MANTGIEQMNIYQKLAKIRMIADVASKDKKGFNYTYADITQILAKVTAGMNKYGVSLLPNITPGTFEVSRNEEKNTKLDKTGKAYENVVTEMLVKADMVFKWVNNDNPTEVIEVPWVLVGLQSDPSQAMGSGLTYCTRYFLTDYFQIAQKDSRDVDDYRSRQKEAQAAEDRAVAESIINQFDVTLKKFLADHPEKKDEVAKFISRYEKKSNYFAIVEPEIASKLLADFEKNYLK